MIYICHTLFVFDEEEKNRIAIFWWCRNERIDIFKQSKCQQWKSLKEPWVWYRNELWSNVTSLTWMSFCARFCWFDKILNAFAKNLFRWNKYEKKNVDVSPCDLRTAKHFIKNIVRGYSTERKRASMYTMLQKWTNFDVDWKRRAEKIFSEISKFVYFVWIFIFTIYSYLFMCIFWWLF